MKGCRTSHKICVGLVCVYDVMTRMDEKLNQKGVEWQQVQENLNRCNQDIKRLSMDNSGAPHQPRAEEKTTGAEMEETGNG